MSLALAGHFDYGVLDHLHLLVLLMVPLVMMMMVLVVMLRHVMVVWEFVLVEEVIWVLFGLGNDRIFEDVWVKLEQPGRVELGLELGCQVIQLDHIIEAVICSALVIELADVNDNEHALGLFHHFLIHLIPDLLN